MRWDARPSRVIYRRFTADEALVGEPDAFGRSKGIRSAVISSCIGSLTGLRLRNLCQDHDGEFGFERQAAEARALSDCRSYASETFGDRGSIADSEPCPSTRAPLSATTPFCRSKYR